MNLFLIERKLGYCRHKSSSCLKLRVLENEEFLRKSIEYLETKVGAPADTGI